MIFTVAQHKFSGIRYQLIESFYSLEGERLHRLRELGTRGEVEYPIGSVKILSMQLVPASKETRSWNERQKVEND